MKKTVSNELFIKAKKLFPGGVNSPVRAWTAVEGEPRFIETGKGSKVWDVDGNQYIDYIGSWGPMILGHSHTDVVDAIKSTVEKGTSFGAPTQLENKLGEMITNTFPSMDKIRLVNSGTEASMSALRLARTYTGRNKIVKFEGGYHGHTDSLLVAAGSGAAVNSVPTSAGITDSIVQDTLVASYNDASSVQQYFDAYPDQIACVIVEPIAANMGVITPLPNFLETLRKITEQNGALLVFDEVVSGYRVGYGGAQHIYNITPDITCLGKIIGGGLPVGAYGGKFEIMEKISPIGPMYQAGTLSGNPVAMAAGYKTLQILQQCNPYPELENRANTLALGLQKVFSETEIPLTINRVGSMMTLFFNPFPVTGWETASASNKTDFTRFFHKMLEQGVYLPPSPLEAMFVSTAHSDSDLQLTIEAAKQALT